jgi:hypothetical protein
MVPLIELKILISMQKDDLLNSNLPARHDGTPRQNH